MTLEHCYNDAFAFVQEHGGTLAHGSSTVMGNGRQRSILHAWVVLDDDTIFDPAAFPEPGIWPVLRRSQKRPERDYSTVNCRFRERFRYSQDEALEWQKKTGSDGPWEGYYWEEDARGAVVRRPSAKVTREGRG